LRDKVKNYRTQIIEALDIVTILDPACGSGAYPMGMLQLCTTTYERLESRFDPYKTKLQIIQNNIFGVDIEPMAVEIARLRVWLSLIVDEEDGRGVEPLPNLDFKFVCANSLVPLNQEIGLFSDTNLHQKLKDIRTKYFNARKPHTKKSLQDEYYSLTKSEQTSLIVDDTRTAQLKSFDPFKNAHPSIFFDNDQMFGLDGGFDIVIGNPPYIQLQKIKPQADMLSELDYKTFARTGDIYCLFYERGFQLLKPKGILSFITSNKWMRAAYGEKLRSYFIHQINPLWLIDFGGHQVFESATVDTNILIAQKAPFENKVKTCVLSKDFRQENMSVYFRQHHAITTSLTAENAWVVLSAIEQSIKEKIESVGTPLKEWEVNIYRGILTGFNEAFIIDQDTKEKLVKKSPKSVDIIRPILRGRDIKKYRSKFGQQWIINTHNGNKDNGIPPIEVERDYPAIFDHLKKYEVQLNARQDKGRHWTNLRNCAYLEDLNKEKIVWIELTDHPNFYLDTDSYYINNTVFFMVGKRLPYVLSFLNSKLCEWYFTKIAATSGAGTRRWIKMYVDQIPVPANIDPSVEIKLSSAVMSVQQYKLEKQDTQEIEGMIERNIMALYAFNAEEIAYINSLSF